MRLTTYAAERERKVFAVGGYRAPNPRMEVVCGWCPAVIQVGTAGAPVSTGICPSCKARHFPTDGDDR